MDFSNPKHKNDEESTTREKFTMIGVCRNTSTVSDERVSTRIVTTGSRVDMDSEVNITQLNCFPTQTGITADQSIEDKPEGMLPLTKRGGFPFQYIDSAYCDDGSVLLDNVDNQSNEEHSTTLADIGKSRALSSYDVPNTSTDIHPEPSDDGSSSYLRGENVARAPLKSGWPVPMSEMNNNLYNYSSGFGKQSQTDIVHDNKNDVLVDPILRPDNDERYMGHVEIDLQRKRQRLTELHCQIQQDEAVLELLQQQSDASFAAIMTNNAENQKLYWEWRKKHRVDVPSDMLPN